MSLGHEKDGLYSELGSLTVLNLGVFISGLVISLGGGQHVDTGISLTVISGLNLFFVVFAKSFARGLYLEATKPKKESRLSEREVHCGR